MMRHITHWKPGKGLLVMGDGHMLLDVGGQADLGCTHCKAKGRMVRTGPYTWSTRCKTHEAIHSGAVHAPV